METIEITKEKHADNFKTKILPEVIDLFRELQTTIDDDYRIEGQDDDTPRMQVTIACDDNFENWAYQTGDNSYAGNCYNYQNWGIAYLSPIDSEDDMKQLADEAIEQMITCVFY